MDGGICSQINTFAFGKFLEDKGFEIKYDLTWYRECGKDTDGRFTIDYKLDKAFPDLEIKVASQEEITYYKQKYKTSEKPIYKCVPPLYVGWYPKEKGFCAVKYVDFLYKYFQPREFFLDGDGQNKKLKYLLGEIKNNNSCGVHIRRGDLGKFNPVYGHPADKEYFLKVINIIHTTNDNVHFYFFSDEPIWTEQNIIPRLKADIVYINVNLNPPEDGYLDLYLLSRCKYIIASNGGLGRYAKLLSGNKSTQVWLNKYWAPIESLDNVYIYNQPYTIPNKIDVFKPNINADERYEKLKKKLHKYKLLFNTTLVCLLISFALFAVCVSMM